MRILPLLLLILSTGLAAGQSLTHREGWVVMETGKPFATLLEDLRTAVADQGFAVVTQAGPTGAARARGIEIPENRVVGVFNNIYAVRILNLSTAAMIEAPIRFYLTEDEDGTATLSYKTPGFVFAPYLDEGGADLAAAATELDAAFEAIANAAIR
ncbi:DUF302 domain-containing protein [Rhodophyticola porphyridii]|uniref:DUF302 domain-containing protein n=1 Tax=Rhodophyticola porphyridii TaxID=1852017 RepID=A0A3L9Y0H8_9RHOB|nr:DUF302 domain-containing protein [Rhodophyticola porphyridii]RMA40875.1 DUF302 domain-containing protein [Rhodophyticola porphyridii]